MPLKTDYMAEGPGAQRRRPSAAWKLAKQLYRRTIRWRTRLPLAHQLFTEKEQMLNVAMQYVRANCVRGDYLEFGCYEGHSFIAAYHFAQAQGLGAMRFYAFDSFCGLPEVTGIDDDPEPDRQYGPGDFACDARTFQRHLGQAGVALDKIQVVEGYYRDSLTPELRSRLPITSAAVVMIDCDFYESTRQALDFVTPYVVDGGVIVFDDWFNFRGDPRRGEQAAFREWLACHPGIAANRYRDFGWHGVSFILSR